MGLRESRIEDADHGMKLVVREQKRDDGITVRLSFKWPAGDMSGTKYDTAIAALEKSMEHVVGLPASALKTRDYAHCIELPEPPAPPRTPMVDPAQVPPPVPKVATPKTRRPGR